MVILEAVFDLDNEEIVIERDDNEKIVKDENGNKIIYTLKESAYNFLSGRDGSLFPICKGIGVNARAIIKSLNKLGPDMLKKVCLNSISKEGECDTSQL